MYRTAQNNIQQLTKNNFQHVDLEMKFSDTFFLTTVPKNTLEDFKRIGVYSQLDVYVFEVRI